MDGWMNGDMMKLLLFAISQTCLKTCSDHFFLIGRPFKNIPAAWWGG
jgi:hypothetical protein